jgi:hypothetical protein
LDSKEICIIQIVAVSGKQAEALLARQRADIGLPLALQVLPDLLVFLGYLDQGFNPASESTIPAYPAPSPAIPIESLCLLTDMATPAPQA